MQFLRPIRHNSVGLCFFYLSSVIVDCSTIQVESYLYSVLKIMSYCNTLSFDQLHNKN